MSCPHLSLRILYRGRKQLTNIPNDDDLECRLAIAACVLEMQVRHLTTRSDELFLRSPQPLLGNVQLLLKVFGAQLQVGVQDASCEVLVAGCTRSWTSRTRVVFVRLHVSTSNLYAASCTCKSEKWASLEMISR
jgi:hypothetical protein